ncbi:MAG TPA: tRNA (adenosine(37)-N6)-threonylcarbamoyltransferase complex dimerization subunit type 1 TsaB [Candidatus Sumerlaeota bacterium]|nr:tRNA (adenosine(37)-N6)-threonylcarbamoyltransferase complex dimerization subunit type 1 TsaB [Candidatus Sumerlaeota bacterium]
MPPATQSPRVVLGIESSTPAGGVALADTDGRLLAHLWRESRQPVSGRLLSDIDTLLEGYDLTREAVAAVAVTLGPGAFTGLRVGLAVAKTLAHGLSAPLFAFSTLEAAAWRTGLAGEAVAVLLDARRAEVYSGVYRLPEAPSGAMEVLREARAEPLASFLEAIGRTDWPTLHLTGQGADLYREALASAAGVGERLRFVPPPLDRPGADSVARLGAHELAAGRAGRDPLTLGPVYLRVSDAEKRHRIAANLEWTAR